VIGELSFEREGDNLLSFGPDWAAQLRILLDFLKNVALAEGGTRGNYRAGDVLDRGHFASRMLARVAGIESSLSAIDQIEIRTRRTVRSALCEALMLACDYHLLTLVDSEPAIVGKKLSDEGARKGAAAKRQNFEARNQRLAELYIHSRADPVRVSHQSDSKIKETIGKSEGLRRAAAIAAINSGLKKLSREPGKPDG
jgi:hypothetical protein